MSKLGVDASEQPLEMPVSARVFGDLLLLSAELPASSTGMSELLVPLHPSSLVGTRYHSHVGSRTLESVRYMQTGFNMHAADTTLFVGQLLVQLRIQTLWDHRVEHPLWLVWW